MGLGFFVFLCFFGGGGVGVFGGRSVLLVLSSTVQQLYSFNLLTICNTVYINSQCHIFRPIRVTTVLTPYTFNTAHRTLTRNLVHVQDKRKEMFYLTTHSTHFILRLYGVGHMVKDHSDSERGNQLPPHGLLFPINRKGSFICTIPQDRIAHTTAFVTPVVEHWLEREK